MRMQVRRLVVVVVGRIRITTEYRIQDGRCCGEVNLQSAGNR